MNKAQLSQKGSDAFDVVYSIIEAFVPKDLMPAIKEQLWIIEGLGFEHTFEGECQLYRALVAAMPENRAEIRAAYQATVFSGSEEDWVPLETDLYRLRLVKGDKN